MGSFWSRRFMKENSIVLYRHHSCFVAGGKVLLAALFRPLPECAIPCSDVHIPACNSFIISRYTATNDAGVFYRIIQKAKASNSIILKSTSPSAIIKQQPIASCEAELSVAEAEDIKQTSQLYFSLSFFSFLSPGGAHSLSKTKGDADKLKQLMSKQATRFLFHHWFSKQKAVMPADKSPHKVLMYPSGLLSQFLCAIAAFPGVVDSLCRGICKQQTAY